MNKEAENSKQIKYFAFNIVYMVVIVLFLSVGIISLLYYDYGLLSFLFALPQFILTGVVPTLVAFLLIYKMIYETERVSISSDGETLTVQVSLIRNWTKAYELASIKYVRLKYKETKTLRWMIIFVLVLITIEVLLQNTIDLLGVARIGPILLICTIFMFSGILIFTFFPRRFIEIGTTHETIYIPYKNRSSSETKKLLEILNVSPSILEPEKIARKIYRNIISQFSNFFLSIFLIGIAVVLMATPFYFGTFTRVISLTLGLKLFSRIINGDRYFPKSGIDNVYLGESLRLTFIKTSTATVERKKSFTPLKSHPLEIICIIFLIFESIRYGYRNLWWAYAEFSPLYFFVGMVFLGLIFIKWFNPLAILKVNFQEFSIKIRESGVTQQNDKSFMKKIVPAKTKQFLINFKSVTDNKYLAISIISFAVFIIWPILYNLYGGPFLFI